VAVVGATLLALALFAAPAAGASAISGQPGTTASSTALSVSVANPSGPAGAPVVGDLATFAVTVSDASGTATSNPTGAVDIFVGSTTGPEACEVTLSANSGSIPLSSSGSCQAPVSAAGTDTYFAVYQGDPVFAPSQQSQQLTGVDSATTTTVSVTAGGTGAAVGDAVEITADVLASSPDAAAAPTGTVTFLDDGTPIGSCVNAALIQGASASAPSFAPCDFTLTQTNNAITATYSGDSSDGLSASCVPAIVEAQPATPTLSLSSSDTAPVAGEVLTIDASLTGVSGVTPTQSIAVDVAVGSGTPQPILSCSDQAFPALGTASCTYSITSTQPLEFTVSYGGDAGYTSAVAVPVDLTPSPATPTVGISTAEIGPIAGQSDSVTATVTGNAVVGAPTGAITVLQGATALTSCGGPITAGDTESVTCPVTYPGAGDVQFTAQVAADANYAAATAKATRRVSLAAPTISVAANVAPVGTTIQVTALVSGLSGITPGPSGSIEVFANGSHLRVCTLTRPSSISEQLSCSYTYTSTVAVTFSATVLPDSNYASATSTPIVEIADRAASKTSLTTVTVGPTVGAALRLTATASGPEAGAPLTGRMEFFESARPGVKYTAISTCGDNGYVGLGYGGLAACDLVVTSATETFWAVYTGDVNYLLSTSAVLRPKISRAGVSVRASKLASATAPVPGSIVHILVTVTGLSAVGSPTGTVSVSGPAGSRCATSCTGNTLHHESGAEAEATFAMIFSASGLVTVKVTYGGSALYLPGTGSVQFAISPPPKHSPRTGSAHGPVIRAIQDSPRLLRSSGGGHGLQASRRSAAGQVGRSIAISRRSSSHA
jgi:hypothetical protein